MLLLRVLVRRKQYIYDEQIVVGVYGKIAAVLIANVLDAFQSVTVKSFIGLGGLRDAVLESKLFFRNNYAR